MYKCAVSGKTIPSERVEALQMLGVPESEWTCVEYSLAKPKKGVYLGEAGTSELLMVSKVYDDTVRSVFNSSKKYLSDGEGSDEAEIESGDTSVYSSKEMNYYAQSEETGDPDENVDVVKRRDI